MRSHDDMTVEWRFHDGADAIVLLDASAEAVSEVSTPDEVSLKAYLAVTGNLERWRSAMEWQPITGGGCDPDAWGELVLSRADSGEVIDVDPELFWERVYARFRSRGVDYNS
jgi:hypothetical protein